MNSGFFVIGSERSGTNLLRTILDNHSQIASPIPLQTLNHFYRLEPYYGDLLKDEVFLDVIKDIIGLINPLRFWDVKFDENKMIADISVENRSVMAVFDYMLNEYCKINGKVKWFCKDINLFQYAFAINEYFENPKFIYLARDPRDVYLSMRNSYNLFPKTAIEFAYKWKKEQDECIQLYHRQKVKGQILFVKYEDMILNSTDCFSEICSFFEINYEKEMLTSQKRDESNISADWKNLSQKIIKGNAEKYKKGLSKKDIIIIENITHREMSYLGYAFDYPDKNIRIGPLRRFVSKLSDYLKKKYNYNILMKCQNPDEYRLRLKEREYIKNIKKRLNSKN